MLNLNPLYFQYPQIRQKPGTVPKSEHFFGLNTPIREPIAPPPPALPIINYINEMT